MGKHKVETDPLCHSVDHKTQIERFKEAARDLETDDDPKRFDERLGKLVKHKPVPEKGK